MKTLVLLLLPCSLFGYSYYETDSFSTINGTNWTQNGSVSPSSSGLTATSANGGSLVSKISVPGVSNEYEVKMTLTLTAAGGTYVEYLDASSNALSGPSPAGNFYSVELQNPTFVNGVCSSATLAIYKSVSGSMTELASTTVGCSNGMTVRAVRTFSNQIATYIDDTFELWVDDGTLTSGQPGVGARNTPSGNSIASANLGQIDTVRPPAWRRCAGGSFSPANSSLLLSRESNAVPRRALNKGPYFLW